MPDISIPLGPTDGPMASFSDVRIGVAEEDSSRPRESFRVPSSSNQVEGEVGAREEQISQGPFEKGKGRVDEPPRKIGWMHFWGMATGWGPRAGTWGKGVEGVEERREEKKGGEGKH